MLARGGCNVSDREFEELVKELMKQDFAAGTEEFRDALLARCLDVLGTDGDSAEAADGVALSDSEIDLLAAAGDLSMFEQTRTFSDNGVSES